MQAEEIKKILKKLVDEGARKGELSAKEINEALEHTDFSVDFLEKFYDLLEQKHIRVVDDAEENLAGDAGNALAGFAKAAFSIPAEKLTTLPRGEGSIVEHAGEKYAVYRDEAGETHVLPSRCPHLGCRLEWNPDDRTWECPCHGSRFGVDGEILSEPAVYGLAQEKDNACADQLIK